MEQQKIDEILEKNNIVDVISNYFPLKKSGSNFKTRCPFHDEKTASFIVSEKKQIFKCFGCGKGGNVITFVRDYEKISFFEALKKLAKRAGISVKETKVSKKKRSKRDLIYKIYSLSVGFYQKNLKDYGDQTLEYLKDRKISTQTIDKFQIGYALNSYAGLKNFLIKNQINSKILKETGLFTSNNKDLFRNRLMFPIHDHSGRVVAFGGRVLHKDQPGGKYVNSPTTVIYKKGSELYGFNVTKYEVSKKDNVLICEGYTDFLRLYESGFKNAVASLGTSLTDDQIKLVSRFTKNFYILYDGDKAGKKAALRAAANISKFGYSVKIVLFNEDEDPDNFLLSHGKKELEKKIAEAKSLSRFLNDDAVLGLNTKTKLSSLIGILNDYQDEISKELFIKEISEVFGVSQKAIFSKLKKKYPIRSTRTNEENTDLAKYEEEKNFLIALVNNRLNHKKVAQEIDSTYFLKEIHKDVFEYLMKNNNYMDNMSVLLDKVDDEKTQNTLAEFILQESQISDADDMINGLKIRKLHINLQKINQKIQQDKDNDEYYKKKDQIKKEIIKLNKKVVSKTLY